MTFFLLVLHIHDNYDFDEFRLGKKARSKAMITMDSSSRENLRDYFFERSYEIKAILLCKLVAIFLFL